MAHFMQNAKVFQAVNTPKLQEFLGSFSVSRYFSPSTKQILCLRL